MRKTLPFILLFALVGAGAWYFLRRPEGGGLAPEEAGFTIRDTASIHRIFLARTDGEHVTLERTPGGGWMLDGKYPALRGTMQQLLSTFYGQTATQPVPKATHNFVVKSLAGQSIKVETFDAKGAPIRSFYVGQETQDFKATYMLMAGAKRPYIITLSGFEGYLTPRYSTSWYDWRDRTVFNAAPADVKQVSVKYAEDQRQSFTIGRAADGLTVALAGPAPSAPNLRRAQDYLGFFQNVNAEGYLNGKSGVHESLASTLKKCDIELTTSAGTTRVAVYWMPVNQRSKNIDDNPFDPDRYYATINGDRDTVIIQQQAFEKIFRDGREFFVTDTMGRQ